MTQILAPLITLLVIGLFVGAWLFYLRRVRQGRADPVMDPSWPNDLRPLPGPLHDSHDTTSSLYLDPSESGRQCNPE